VSECTISEVHSLTLRFPSLIPVFGAGAIHTAKPSQQLLYMVEGYLSLRSATLWHETTNPGSLAEELGYAMRGKSESLAATKADLLAAEALIEVVIGEKGRAMVEGQHRSSVDLEKGLAI